MFDPSDLEDDDEFCKRINIPSMKSVRSTSTITTRVIILTIGLWQGHHENAAPSTAATAAATAAITAAMLPQR
jgi:hypothetical protein